MKRHFIFSVFLIFFVSVSLSEYFEPEIHPGNGVTQIKKLSEYNEYLYGTAGDTPVYFLNGEKDGPTFLLIGGTHPREIAGTTAAIIFIEKLVVDTGNVIIIPFANLSAASTRDLSSNVPHELEITYAGETRKLIFGDRRTSPDDQGEPDPLYFLHEKSGIINKDPTEARNLNRNYPGVKDGNLTERIAYAIINLIKTEEVDFELDMHESRTPDSYTDSKGIKREGSKLANTIVCHPDAMEMGVFTVIYLEDNGIRLSLEESKFEYSGLSHWEIGEETNCLAFLSETPNPAQDTWRIDPDTLYDEKYPLKHRIGINFEIISTLLQVYGEFFDETVEISNMPKYDDFMKHGFEKYMF